MKQTGFEVIGRGISVPHYMKAFRNLEREERARPAFPKEKILRALICRRLRDLPLLADLA